MEYFLAKKRGFTLIELLVVISIVSLLSSVVYANAATGRVKAQDAKKIVEARQVETAIRLFVEDNGRGPLNYGNDIAIEGTPAYESSMQELVAGGYLAEIPETGDVGTPYAYYDFGEGSAAGVLFATELKSTNAASGGPTGSCSPFKTITAHYTDGETGMLDSSGVFEYSDGSECGYGAGFYDPYCYSDEECMEHWIESWIACWAEAGGGICGSDPESSDYCVCVPY